MIAIEPAPDACQRLLSLIRTHGFEDRFEIHQAALGAEPGLAKMDLMLESQFRSTGTGSTTVPVKTLDQIIRNRTIDLLKIDIEGGEYSVLPASKHLSNVQGVAMEYHPNKSTEDLRGFLSMAGLPCTSIRKDGEGYGVATFAQYPFVRELTNERILA